MAPGGRRFLRKSSKSPRTTSPDPSYVPPAVAPIPEGNAVTTAGVPEANYVTQLPKPAKALTGKISTLFRRDASQERQYESPSESAIPELDAVSTRSDLSRQRIFYSSNNDDDSDDSYESRLSRNSRLTQGQSVTKDMEDEASDTISKVHSELGSTTIGSLGSNAKTIVRYRGFSTSIKSLFLDEALVCASIGCFGLLLSNRTEYLLHLRNERRGTLSPRRGTSDRKKLPSRIIAYGLLITLLLMFTTFVIWGFGSGNGLANGYLMGYDYHDDGGQAQQTQRSGDDYYSQWDDYLSSRRRNNDDKQQARAANDDAAANDDGAAKNDDAAAGDDANKNDDAKQNDDNGDDAQQNGDDAKANDDGNKNDAANDDGNKNDAANDDAKGDDGAKNDDAKQADDYYSYNGNRRVATLEVEANAVLHRPHGIFKLRDYKENFLDPLFDFVHNEWDRPEELHGRRDEEDAYAAGKAFAQRDIASNIRVALLFAFLLFLGVLGRRRRMRTRFYIVRARAQEDHLYYASSDQAASRRVAFEDSREDQYEGACSHTLCGCYPVDETVENEDDEEVEVTDTGIFRRKKKPHHEDIVARAFSCFMASCCGIVCKCWFQCLSVCALAQEAREMRLLIPPRYQRIDFITHQPFHEYQKNVNDLRRGWMGKTRRKAGIMPHFHALSKLSRYIVLTFLFSIVVIVATLVFNPRAAFSWQDAVVLVATFLQSFLVLFFVHWIFHKSDLSLDAVIKLFAAGFLIAVPTAFFFEGLLVNIVLFTTWFLYDLCEAIGGDNFSTWVFDHWRMIWILGELFNAYIVAAVTEELCKYYTFRAVEHPDLVFLTGLQRQAQDDQAIEGGLVKYPFASHQVQELIRERSNDDGSVKSYRSNSSRRNSRRSRRSRRDEYLIEQTGTTDQEFDEDENDVRTYRQKAMAITTGMISVAVGLACAENFLYVFVLGGALGNASDEEHRGDLLEAWIVLFFRSIFPIHALAAAMQSINMIRKFVESSDHNGHRIGVGRIILPAVIVHGSFDAVLMGINVYMETAWDNYLRQNGGNVGDDDPYNALVVNLVAWISITLIMLGGIFWYYRENRNQRLRLILLEEKEKAQTEDPAWATASSTKEVELV